MARLAKRRPTAHVQDGATIGPELEVGTQAILRLVMTYQTCGPGGCSAPGEKTVTLRLPVVPADARRGQLYGWQNW